jgi:hypothetical protein
MSRLCSELHHLVRQAEPLSFPFDVRRIPTNGIYVLFEVGEYGHDEQRIVRVGTHTGESQLLSRLNQHFMKENKDRSIFRKNIGRALLNRANDPFLAQWELDLTTSEAKLKYATVIDFAKQRTVEAQVTKYIQENFTFVVFCIDDKATRLDLESKMISTVSLCNECGPSDQWLGLHSPRSKIQSSGLWVVNELYKKPLAETDLVQLKRSDQRAD